MGKQGLLGRGYEGTEESHEQGRNAGIFEE